MKRGEKKRANLTKKRKQNSTPIFAFTNAKTARFQMPPAELWNSRRLLAGCVLTVEATPLDVWECNGADSDDAGMDEPGAVDCKMQSEFPTLSTCSGIPSTNVSLLAKG
jgi:hypothetical protein